MRVHVPIHAATAPRVSLNEEGFALLSEFRDRLMNGPEPDRLDCVASNHLLLQPSQHGRRGRVSASRATDARPGSRFRPPFKGVAIMRRRDWTRPLVSYDDGGSFADSLSLYRRTRALVAPARSIGRVAPLLSRRLPCSRGGPNDWK
jgi:hypothetical protein